MTTPDPPPARGYPDAESFATPARARIAASTRALVDAVVTSTNATDTELDATATRIDALVAGLHDAGAGARAAPAPVPEPTSGTGDTGSRRRHGDYVPRSPLVGAVNPQSPPFEWEFVDGRVVARGVFTAAYEGPPGYVHGGWVALAFDEVLGLANVASGYGGLTGRLTVRYRRPTPLYTDVRIEAHTARVEGRRLVTVGTLHAGGALTAEAEGLFVMIGEDRALEYFGERP